MAAEAATKLPSDSNAGTVDHTKGCEAEVLILEAFYDGSHKQMIDTILDGVDPSKYLLLVMSGKKWHWRARTSGLHFQQRLQRATGGKYKFKKLFASNVLNLVEFVAMRPEFNSVEKILYFHENELNYPVVEPKERDFHYGYTQILSCMVADVIYFNSSYNMSSFLSSIRKCLNLIPDYRPDVPEMISKITPKCRVAYYPVIPPPLPSSTEDQQAADESGNRILKIVWPHRWEHDKDPGAFFDCLRALKQDGCRFRVAILGQQFDDVPPVFAKAREEFDVEITQFGFLPQKEDYWRMLLESDVVVSTAYHEFFGVGMVEAAMAGCYPICPDGLSYPEIFPKECLYRTPAQLKRALVGFCRHPHIPRKKAQERGIPKSLEKFSSAALVPEFRAFLGL